VLGSSNRTQPVMMMRSIFTTLGVLTLLAGQVLGAAKEAASSRLDFGRDIRPILSDNCFACHGPDEKARKAKLRLDTREGALATIDGRAVISPGHAAESELIKRILTHDAEEVMPPPKTGKKLTEPQIDLLRRWIDGGAKWTSHWAYEAPKRPSEPEVKQKSWPRNAIDKFILARLEKEGLKPSPRADKVKLIRRVTLDLTGLPPTPDEVDAFTKDKSADAYDKLVDRLLQSPRLGEHMTKYWLDAARYADSHGYHIDSQRDIWAYRDWLVGAFNQNLPFDQFTIEQLAGDLLPDATTEQKIASGYVRCNMSTGDDGHDLDGADADLRPLPHAQVRSDSAQGILRPLRFLQSSRRAGDG
jgi:mono/diheme cytochrome c family protein